MDKMKYFEPEELSAFSGKDGAPVYISYGGKVYDVSGSKLWKTGTHMMKHKAGSVLDSEIAAAPHGPEVLERVLMIGELKIPAARQAARKEPEESALSRFLNRYPILRRHPHPMVVHFPIALIIGSLMLEAAFLLTGFASLRTSSLQCLGLGFLFLPFAVGTGYLTWIINYMAQPVRQVKIKIRLSWPLFIISMAVLVWQINAGTDRSPVYFLTLLVLSALVSLIGYFGGQLTMPLDKK